MSTPPGSVPGLYTAAQCRELDRLAIEEHGLPGFELMQRAGRAAFRALTGRWPEARRIVVCCGRGNNAGDGYLIAALALEIGLDVVVHELAAASRLSGDAARARAWAADRGVRLEPGLPAAISADLVVDALLGTGIRGELRAPFDQAVRLINGAGCPVLAVDIPTGVNADTGAVTRDAVRATLTVTFIGRKLGLFTGPGAAYAGSVVFEDLGVPAGLYRQVRGVPWLRYSSLPGEYRLQPRDAGAYKHALGHVVVVGGDHGMGGAPLMAAEAALRTGAGMVSIITRAAHRPAILARRPEIMVIDADVAGARQATLAKADVLVVGPGLGQDPWGRSLLEETLHRRCPTVLDADGLNNLAVLDLKPASPTVITPHAAEAARLLGCDTGAVQRDRPAAARALVRRTGAAVVLKGAGSIVAAPSGGNDAVAVDRADGTRLLGVCAHGNPGMASAGMGDVLSGVIGGLLAQGLDTPAAAVAGTCLHSCAGDRGAERVGQRSLLATDLLGPLMDVLHEEERGWR